MIKEGYITAIDGKQIFYREWTCNNPKGLVQIVHGMAESTDRYNGLAEYLSSKGYVVFGDDHRGHGKTDNCSGYDSGNMFFNTLTDVSLLGTFFKKIYSGLPLVILGHSYGSFLTQAYIQKYADKIDGAIIGGSAMMDGGIIKAGRVIATLGCIFGMAKKPAKLLATMSFGAYNKQFEEGSFISSIKEECEKYDAHPECGFTLSNNFYRYFFKGLSTLYKEENYLNIPSDKPLLLIAGKEDPVGEKGKSVERLYDFYKNTVGVKSVEKILYDGVRHEYFNDTSKITAYEDVEKFISKIANG